jgi:Mrp family chromosome partitioning ATPase
MVGGSRRVTDTQSVTGLTIGITTPRSPACKRGLAVNVAASLARDAARGSRLCLVDADPFARDVTIRLAVSGPHLEDFAGSHVADAGAFADSLADLHEPALSVLPSAGTGVGPAHRGVGCVLPALRETFDIVICDLVCGPSGPARVVSNRLEQLDWLLLAVTPQRAPVEAAGRFVDQFEEARDRGHVAASVRLGIVATGDEGSTDLGALALAELLGPPFLGSVRQLWGRAVPNFGFGAALGIDELDHSVGALFARLSGAQDRPFALAGAAASATSRAL